MIETEQITILTIVLAVLLIISLAIALQLWRRVEQSRDKNSRLREEYARIETTLESERKHTEDRVTQAKSENREQLNQLINELTTQALKNNSDSFLKLAQEIGRAHV